MTSFRSFEAVLKRSSKILKKNEKFFIANVKSDDQSRKLVIKVELAGSSKLRNEIERIQGLKTLSTFYQEKLPTIAYAGVFSAGLLAGHDYYVMERLLGEPIANTAIHADASILVNDANLEIFDELAENVHQIEKHTDFLPRSDLFDALLDDITRLSNLPMVGNLLKSHYHCIGGTEYRNFLGSPKDLIGLLEETFRAVKFRNGSNLHNNYHGGNIIVSSGLDNYRLIDPDVSVTNCDTTFGLARFLYTDVHEQCEHNLYLIDSIEKSDEAYGRFDLKEASEGLSPPFEALKIVDNIFNRLPNEETTIRLKLSLLRSLIRGIFANHETHITNESSKGFSNKSVFLYLNTLIFWQMYFEQRYQNLRTF